MSITHEKKQELIKEYSLNEKDTGSPEVQCAILTVRINNLTEHMKANPKDHTSRRGLIVMVNRRKKLLSYINNKEKTRYEGLIKRLGLRK